jgi:predicted DNA-binding transcriptional regulator AlpA
MSENEYLCTKIVARRLGISPRTLENYRQRGIGPNYVRLGRTIRYRWSDIRDWIEACGKAA